MLAAGLIVMLVLILVALGAVVPLVLHARGLGRRVNALEENLREDYVNGLNGKPRLGEDAWADDLEQVRAAARSYRLTTAGQADADAAQHIRTPVCDGYHQPGPCPLSETVSNAWAGAASDLEGREQ
jgi:hypothetical protein